jgi:hypothetical protein
VAGDLLGRIRAVGTGRPLSPSAAAEVQAAKAEWSRVEAGQVLRDGWTDAGRLQARWLQREAAALARRARIDLDPAAEPVPAPGRELGLTPGSVRSWPCSPTGAPTARSPSAVHRRQDRRVNVSNILAKLQVADRGEAAAVAHRLGLTGEPATGR